MARRALSIGLKFPLLMVGIVLGTSAVFVWQAYREFRGILYETSASRLESSGALVVGLLRDTGPSASSPLGRAARLPDLRQLLTGEARTARAAQAALAAALPQLNDSSRLRVQLLGAAGDARLVHALRDTDGLPSWTAAAAARGELSPTTPTLSPVLDRDGAPYYEVAMPVHARDDGESHVGYLVDTREIRGRGVADVQRIVGTRTLLIGDPTRGVWTDFLTVVDPPPAIVRRDTAFVFDESPRGPGQGVAMTIPGVPWVVWLQIPRSEVLAPARSFLWRMAPVAVLVALIGALVAWLFSRRITRRITALTAELDEVESGTAGRAVRVHEGRDELDRLVHALRLMWERSEKQHQLEAQLMQSQKLEAVGRLAGGIAHDFNNMLTVVSNYAELIQTDLEPGSAAARDMDEVMHATQGAAKLTRQLLAFSRRQVLQPMRVDLNEIIRGSHRMLQRLIPSNVEFVLDLDATIGPVNADPGQIEQVLVNLTLNAADAMPSGGRLTFRTATSDLDDPESEAAAGPPASRRHVTLAVVDSGVGMDAETASRVFEPFFTTKPVGKGTGLGLASVHGIVTQLGGRIWVYSEPGHGTTFKLYFPEMPGAPEPISPAAAFKEPPRGEAAILLVEDDAATREVTRRVLTRHGYSVLLATHGREALEILSRPDHGARAVLSDVMMPEMDGIELAAQISDRWPQLPVLLMSGYSDADLRAKGDRQWTFKLIEKPFTTNSLLAAVAQAVRNGVKPAGA